VLSPHVLCRTTSHALACNRNINCTWLCRLALEHAESHPLIKDELGLPLTTGPWYNASVDMTHTGHIASCRFALCGRHSSSDLLIRVRHCCPLSIHCEL
jgi:hypothetical protein